MPFREGFYMFSGYFGLGGEASRRRILTTDHPVFLIQLPDARRMDQSVVDSSNAYRHRHLNCRSVRLRARARYWSLRLFVLKR